MKVVNSSAHFFQNWFFKLQKLRNHADKFSHYLDITFISKQRLAIKNYSMLFSTDHSSDHVRLYNL